MKNSSRNHARENFEKNLRKKLNLCKYFEKMLAGILRGITGKTSDETLGICSKKILKSTKVVFIRQRIEEFWEKL